MREGSSCLDCTQFGMCHQRRELATLLEKFAGDGGLMDVRTEANKMYGDGVTTWPMFGLLLGACCVHGGIKE